MKWLVRKHFRRGAQAREPGDVVELGEAAARFVNEDEPGTLVPYVESAPIVEARQVEKPAQDRMARQGKKR
jgi:hypothetical protein